MKNTTTWAAILVCLISAHLAYGQNEPPAGAPYAPYPTNVVVTKVKHFDNMCWKIAAAGGTWYFENGETSGRTGFSSAFDQVGNDWIGNDADKGYNTSPKGSGKHEYRGFPNLGNGNFDHPQRSSGSKTKWVNENGQEIPFSNSLEGDHLIMRSYNATYEVEYHFFTTHIALKIIKANDKFAFLFEGPVGGEQENNSIDKWYTKDGAANQKQCNISGCSSPFIYFVDTDPKDTQILYLGAANLNNGVGGEAYVAANNMVVVSYGRSGSYPNDTRKLTGTDPISVIGFLPKADSHTEISNFIDEKLANPFTAPISVGSPNITLDTPNGTEELEAPAFLNLSATATDENGTISKVDFFNDENLLFSDNSTPYTYNWEDIPAGTYTVRAVATDNEGNTSSVSRSITIKTPQSPYNGVKHTIPGIVEAEAFDEGGNGTAYYDDSPGSETGETFRDNEDVDIEACSDVDGGYNIGWATAGEWLEYAVDVDHTGKYNLEVRVACDGDGRTLDLQIGDQKIDGIAIPNTDGWQTWQTVHLENVDLIEGQQIMKMTIGEVSYININYIEFKSLITGENEEEAFNFDVFPNPSLAGFTVYANQAVDYSVYDLTGTVVEKGRCDGIVNFGNSLKSGIYLLKAESASETKILKITKK